MNNRILEWWCKLTDNQRFKIIEHEYLIKEKRIGDEIPRKKTKLFLQ